MGLPVVFQVLAAILERYAMLFEEAVGLHPRGKPSPLLEP